MQVRPPRNGWDHPREYGENQTILFSVKTVKGSSPRIRGEYRFPGGEPEPAGIIPANTGRIEKGCPLGPDLQDHPREYGENPEGLALPILESGSSPRIRGESGQRELLECARGIIPANTGRMSCSKKVSPVVRDHPREYGENSARVGCCGGRVGSSPRIRGE